ncbi:MAG: MaoC family dehydratase [Chloroflexota bacterium]
MGRQPVFSLAELSQGMSLPEMKKDILQENINLYAKASQDFNPIHIDEAFARKTPLGGTIAHGMLLLAYPSQMMTAAFGRAWLEGGTLSVRFKGAARPGDTITVSGNIAGIARDGEQATVSCTVLCRNQQGEPVVTGETSLRLKEK